MENNIIELGESLQYAKAIEKSKLFTPGVRDDVSLALYCKFMERVTHFSGDPNSVSGAIRSFRRALSLIEVFTIRRN